MNRSESCPHSEINMVCPLDVHRHAHRRGVCHKRMCRMVGRHDDAGADRLLAKVIVKNLLLDALHNVASKEADDRQIHARIHQTERIAGGDDTIK